MVRGLALLISVLVHIVMAMALTIMMSQGWQADHTLPGDYFSTKKVIKDLGLPVEKIDACNNGCMLYWKDDVALEYCKFCEDARYKPFRERDLCRKKSPYAILREACYFDCHM
ncbi:UNVERIFIED_CONTAM: hypothetical protein Sangu_2958500 [Sesamum angustifolium]|uniref:Uncharacterized protein n=1 Tax=Sesamum angustifolium TaxID=2727405 RepID=A0AAW2IK98_9LAMI